MKPTSVIFIIISVLLACVGLLLMFTASNMADSEGVALFTQSGDADNNYYTSVDFDGESIKKIVFSLGETNVNIIGGSEKNYVELVNFPDGTYELSTSKSTMQLNDNTAISNIIDVDNLKINFNGFRDYLHYFKYKDKERTVNLHLTDDAVAIIVNITAGGDVTLSDLSLDCDYKIKVSDGNVTLDNVKTDSSVIIDSTDDSNITMTYVSVNEIEVNGVTAYATLKNTSVERSLYIKIISGDVEYDRVESDFAGFDVHLETKSGIIKYNDNKYINEIYVENNYVAPADPENPEDSENTDESEDDTGDTAADEETDSGETEEGTETESSAVVNPYSVTIIVNEGNITVY